MILDCTQHDPEDRPDFTQIRDRMVCWGGRWGVGVKEVGWEEWEERRKSGGRKGYPFIHNMILRTHAAGIPQTGRGG